MCLIAFAYQAHKKYPLVIAANRDEFLDRPTASAHFWEDFPNVLAGRDLEKMGTWIGVTKEGRVAAITNYRNPRKLKVNVRSRGELVSNYLHSNLSPEQYLKEIIKVRDRYNGFNLIVGNHEHLYYYSNQTNQMKRLTPGIYGLSNHLLNTDWEKVKRSKQMLTHCLSQPVLNTDCLFQLLLDETIAEDHLLPDTGIGLEKERILSPIFINGEKYGTRSSTVILIDKEGHISYKERVYAKDKNWKERSFNFTIKGE